uniref:Cytochrome P450 n=1 Tax=Dunaliella salina TaxID=3046 RepID=A0ABQ7H4E3_DUNSA
MLEYNKLNKTSYSDCGQMLRMLDYQFCTTFVWQMCFGTNFHPLFFHTNGSSLTQNLSGSQHMGQYWVRPCILVRRRAVVPAFHKQYYEVMAKMFGDCTMRSVQKLDEAIAAGQKDAVVDMESEFLNLGLEIIGLGVFNYDFGAINKESPVIKAVYGVLKEAEHRSTFYIPYWDIPITKYIVPRQVQFHADLRVINECLDGLIQNAQATRQEDDSEALQNRDYSKVKDPSLLRFLVDMRGEDATNKQLRDDLMTMLIAGHETTAAVLTWALFCLTQKPAAMAKVVEEVDRVVGDKMPSIDDIRAMSYTRATLGESLRLYPQPPLLIRRALSEDKLPPGLNGDPNGYPIGKGADIFISVWNLHHSPHLWKDPEEFRPERFYESFQNPGFNGAWAGVFGAGGGKLRLTCVS